MTTAQDIYDKALVLMDAQSDSDTSEYEEKSIPILNVLRGECFPYSDTFAQTEDGKRPICPVVTAFIDQVQMDDYICQSVLPYGLAAHLLMDENPSTASFLMERYNELLNDLKMGKGGTVCNGSIDIEDVYGDRNGNSRFYYNRFSVWG